MELTADELERARRGDRRARARLVEVYQDRIYAVCRALAGDDAYDCAHDSFLKILTSLDRFDHDRPSPFSVFAVRIARNTCLDRRRAARVRDHVELGEPADRAPGPAAAAAKHERDERVRAAVLALPEDQRAAIALRLWGELEYEHIAAIEGVPVGTIRSRLARARDALRALLRDEEVADAS